MIPSISNSSDNELRNRLQLFTESHNTTDVLITAIGPVDMTTALDFGDYVAGRAVDCQHLIVDLTQTTFFDCAGFSALCYIDERCQAANITWTIHPSFWVSRVVALCDPRSELPVSAASQPTEDCA